MLEPAVLERTQKNVLVAGVFRNSSNNRRLLEEAKAFHADMEAHNPSHTLEEYMESSPAMRQRPPRVGKALFALGGRYKRNKRSNKALNRRMTPHPPPPAHKVATSSPNPRPAYIPWNLIVAKFRTPCQACMDESGEVRSEAESVD